MNVVKDFEELKCWKATRQITHEIYIVTREGKISKDFGMKDQIRRASLSTMNNIAEGFAKYSKKEFIRFLNISQSSAAEVKSRLYLITDLNYIKEKKLTDLHQQVDSTRRLTRGLIKYLNQRVDQKK